MIETIIIRDPATRNRVIKHIGCLNLSRPWVVTIKRHAPPRRTLSQNALMWKWINEVAAYVHEATGQDSDQIHEFFKEKFLPPRIIELGGETVTYRTTTKLTIEEMSDYMGKIYAWVTSELGLMLPYPEPTARVLAR